MTTSDLHPTEHFGLPTYSLDMVKGGSAAYNAALLRHLAAPTLYPLPTDPTPQPDQLQAITDFILLNAAALAHLAGLAPTRQAAVELCRERLTAPVAGLAHTIDACAALGQELLA